MNTAQPGDHHQRDAHPNEPTDLVRLDDGDDLITAVSYLLGYQPPDRSLVVVGVRQRELTVAIRISLPPLPRLGSLGGLPAAWTALTTPLAGCDCEVLTATLGEADGAAAG
jgi:Domain of unknown function (DUF4192)